MANENLADTNIENSIVIDSDIKKGSNVEDSIVGEASEISTDLLKDFVAIQEPKKKDSDSAAVMMAKKEIERRENNSNRGEMDIFEGDSEELKMALEAFVDIQKKKAELIAKGLKDSEKVEGKHSEIDSLNPGSQESVTSQELVEEAKSEFDDFETGIKDENENFDSVEIDKGKEYSIEGENFEVSNADLEYIIQRLENGDEETSNPDMLEVVKKELKKREDNGFNSEDKELSETEDEDKISVDEESINKEQSEKYASEILEHINIASLEGDRLTEMIEDSSIEIKPAIYEIMCECIFNIRSEELKYKGKINEDDSRKIDSRIQELCDSYGISYETATRESVQEDLNNHLKYENIFQEIKDKLRTPSDEKGQEEEILEETESERVKRESIEELCKNDPIAKEYYESSLDGKRAKIEDGKNEARIELGKDLAMEQKTLGENAEQLTRQREDFKKSMDEAHKTFEAQKNSLKDICKTAEFKNLSVDQKMEIKEVMNMFGNLAKSHINLERIIMLEKDMIASANNDPDILLESFPNHDNTIRTWESIMDSIDNDIEEIAENEEKALEKWFKFLKENSGDAILIIAAIAGASLGVGMLTASTYGIMPGVFTGVGTGLAGTWAATKTTMAVGLVKSLAIAKTGAAIGAVGGLAVAFLALVDEKHRDSLMEWFTGKSVPSYCRVGKESKV